MHGHSLPVSSPAHAGDPVFEAAATEMGRPRLPPSRRPGEGRDPYAVACVV